MADYNSCYDQMKKSIEQRERIRKDMAKLNKRIEILKDAVVEDDKRTLLKGVGLGITGSSLFWLFVIIL